MIIIWIISTVLFCLTAGYRKLSVAIVITVFVSMSACGLGLELEARRRKLWILMLISAIALIVCGICLVKFCNNLFCTVIADFFVTCAAAMIIFLTTYAGKMRLHTQYPRLLFWTALIAAEIASLFGFIAFN
ncbi:unnamed protein product [Trichobilharzia szidati]|nr:unnamed protein product [Trichobilharzia szidati]